METLSCNKCGLVDDYTISDRGVHKTAFCNGCGSYIKNVAYQPPALYFGKYSGREIKSLTSDEEVRYLQWLTIQTWLKPKVKEQVDAHLKTV